MTVFRLQGMESGDGKGRTCHSGIKRAGPQARCGPEAQGEEESERTRRMGAPMTHSSELPEPIMQGAVLHLQETDGKQVTKKGINAPAAKCSLEDSPDGAQWEGFSKTSRKRCHESWNLTVKKVSVWWRSGKMKNEMTEGPTAESLRVKMSETGMDYTHWENGSEGSWLTRAGRAPAPDCSVMPGTHRKSPEKSEDPKSGDPERESPRKPCLQPWEGNQDD